MNVKFDMTKPTVDNALTQSDIYPKYNEMDQENAMVFVHLINGYNNKTSILDTLINMSSEKDVYELKMTPISQIFIKRIKALGLEDAVDEDMFIMLYLFDISNPGQIILFLMNLLDYYLVHNKKATLYIVATKIFPFGFYTDETCTEIIDKLIKTKIVRTSEIY